MIVENEHHLAAFCRALLDNPYELSIGEWRLIKGSGALSTDATDVLRAQIKAGGDPLGDMFLQLRQPEERRLFGATYTPNGIVASMIRWSSERGKPQRIVDPGAGSGRFILAAADAFPDAELVAIERDPLAALILRANLAVRGVTNRIRIYVEDYRTAAIGYIKGRTLFLGNPPYVRHHQIDTKEKVWFGDATSQLGVPASKLAGLHIHFFVRTAQLAKAGDFGVFITSSEWLDVNYGVTLRRLLADRLGGLSLQIIDPKALPFSDAMTTGTITCFHVGSKATHITMRCVKSVAMLNGLNAGKRIDRVQARSTSRWSTFLHTKQNPPTDYVELGELFSVHRGQVTGGNAIWIEGPHARDLPLTVLFPTITRGRELLAAGEAVSDARALRRVIDLPAELDALPPEYRRAVLRFLKFAKSRGAHESYIARHRRAWWAVGLREPAPVLVTYMARRAPAFVRNLCGARHINIAHGLYPRQKMGEKTLETLVCWLRDNVRVENGRTYAGGLTKFEPREIERLHVPSPEAMLQ